MHRVKFVSSFAFWPWHRQTPNGDGVFENFHFIFDPAEQDYDYLVVFEQFPDRHTEACDPNRAIFVCGEPPNIKRYSPQFLTQFGTILGSDPSIHHKNVKIGHTGLNWHFGIATNKRDEHVNALTFKEIEALAPQKSRKMSVICSNKAKVPEHYHRLQFVKALQRRFGDQIDVFGRGFNEIDDKAEALTAYRYHIALENCSIPHYWTEKMSDPLLAGCLPIYCGATTIANDFPSGSFIPIDMQEPKKAFQTIATILADDPYELHKDALAKAKKRVLYQHNLFALLAHLISDQEKSGAPSAAKTEIKPEALFPQPPKSKLRRLRKISTTIQTHYTLTFR